MKNGKHRLKIAEQRGKYQWDDFGICWLWGFVFSCFLQLVKRLCRINIRSLLLMRNWKNSIWKNILIYRRPWMICSWLQRNKWQNPRMISFTIGYVRPWCTRWQNMISFLKRKLVLPLLGTYCIISPNRIRIMYWAILNCWKILSKWQRNFEKEDIWKNPMNSWRKRKCSEIPNWEISIIWQELSWQGSFCRKKASNQKTLPCSRPAL